MLPRPTLPEPVSLLQADFTLLDRGSGPTVEMSSQAPVGSAPHHLQPGQKGRARPRAAETTPRAARQLLRPTDPGLVPVPGR